MDAYKYNVHLRIVIFCCATFHILANWQLPCKKLFFLTYVSSKLTSLSIVN